MNDIKILAFDGTALSVEVFLGTFDSSGTLKSSMVHVDKKQNSSGGLVLAIDKILGQSGISGVDLVAVCSGPGTFTSLRTVIATANAISFSTHKKCIGVSAFEVLIEQNFDNVVQARKDGVQSLVCMAPAYSGQVYAQRLLVCGCDNGCPGCFLGWRGGGPICVPMVQFQDNMRLLWSSSMLIQADPKTEKASFIACAAARRLKLGQLFETSMVEVNYVKQGLGSGLSTLI